MNTRININDLPFSKRFMKFGWPEPSKEIFDFWNFLLVETAFDPICKGPPLEILVFSTNYIFFGKAR